MSHSCLSCIHKNVCMERGMFLFEYYIFTGRFGEVEDAKENLDIGVGCENYIPKGDDAK